MKTAKDVVRRLAGTKSRPQKDIVKPPGHPGSATPDEAAGDPHSANVRGEEETRVQSVQQAGAPAKSKGQPQAANTAPRALRSAVSAAVRSGRALRIQQGKIPEAELSAEDAPAQPPNLPDAAAPCTETLPRATEGPPAPPLQNTPSTKGAPRAVPANRAEPLKSPAQKKDACPGTFEDPGTQQNAQHRSRKKEQSTDSPAARRTADGNPVRSTRDARPAVPPRKIIRHAAMPKESKREAEKAAQMGEERARRILRSTPAPNTEKTAVCDSGLPQAAGQDGVFAGHIPDLPAKGIRTVRGPGQTPHDTGILRTAPDQNGRPDKCSRPRRTPEEPGMQRQRSEETVSRGPLAAVQRPRTARGRAEETPPRAQREAGIGAAEDDRGILTPRGALEGISPDRAAGIYAAAKPAAVRSSFPILPEMPPERMPPSGRDLARRAVRKGMEDTAAALRPVRRGAGRPQTKRVFGGTAPAESTSPGRVVIVLILVSLFALACGLTMSFVGAAGSSANAAGGAGYMDLTAVTDMKQAIGREWAAKLLEHKQRLLVEGALYVTVRYNASDTGDGDTGVRLDNWNDVFAVWLAKNNRVLRPSDLPQVRDIYFEMNPVSARVAVDAAEESCGYIDVYNLRAEDAEGLFSLSVQQLEDIRSWISPVSKNSVFWRTLLGWPVADSTQFSALYLDVPPGSAAQIVLQEAQARAGWIYSQERRTQRGYADCSSLVASCYAALGVRLGGVYPTAAEIGRFCDAHACRVPAAQAQPGDLILWGGRDNGRYLGIYHVAMYAGDGMMWEASPSAGGVVYRPIREQNPSRIVFYARPLSVVGGQWDSHRLPAGVTCTQTIVLSTTAYCEACDTIYGEGRTASGTYPQRGTVATSRTKQFAFGTRLYIPGYGYGTIEDTGGFSDGTIDLYLGHRSVCTCGSDWGRKTLTVYVLS